MAGTIDEIFYVDDSPDDRFFARYSIEKGHFPLVLTIFETGNAALRELERRVGRAESLPALLVADHYMPVMDGPELLRLIRKKDELRAVKLAICSGGDDPADLAAAQEAGAAALLAKPIDFELCHAMLRSIDSRA